ncbi:MAG: ABC transporter substrate-binding protein [Planctomycetota bacterium]|jgi:hypothetical protein
MRNWILGLAIALFGCGNSGSDDGKLKVGVILPMTGNTATYGEESWNGIQLAMEVLREQGFDCELILKDEKSEKPMAGNQAKLLVENEGVHVLIGSVASSNTEQIALVAKESGVPLITPASTNDGITTKGGPLVSRICFNDSFQGAVLANFAINEGWKKAVAVVDSAQVYSTGLSKNIRKTFEARGGSYVEEFYTTQDTDFSNTISNVANHKPDIIFICGYYNEGGPMIRQAGEGVREALREGQGGPAGRDGGPRLRRHVRPRGRGQALQEPEGPRRARQGDRRDEAPGHHGHDRPDHARPHADQGRGHREGRGRPQVPPQGPREKVVVFRRQSSVVRRRRSCTSRAAGPRVNRSFARREARARWIPDPVNRPED